ncbi:TIGR02587 family membrane protein [Brasilonema sp. UFV-L1]|uniref:TIGR02587 family membrane protein n=1 Tax=Brasilonema sp. UFV-L1 TaxID=2234130 RepID=UPI00145DE816|nr:TIGR02587 family membrane protein [Brasilonema sp. UFV-L1]NMG06741.1 TIGR02587 family membrane protein [Brasilonema sp. UFV-L1]
MSVGRKRRKNVWANEINDIIRGACGGFLFGIPLLYTMEVWWIGSIAKPSMILLAIALMFLVVFLLNRTEGFRTRSRRNSPPYGAVTDTIEAMAIGLVCSALMLLLLQELTPETAIKETLGKIVFESVPFTLGVALANQFLGDTRDPNDQGRTGYPSDKSQKKPDELHATFADIGATLIGATVIAFNIAPTDEIPMLAAAVTPPWLLAVVTTSIIISYGIVFEAGFWEQQKRRQQRGIFQRPISETIMAYLVSLLAAAFMLWFFQKLTFGDPWTIWLEYTLLLGLPATIGGAAGRLAV